MYKVSRKKHFKVFVLVFALGMATWGQGYGQLAFGVKGGYTLADVAFDPSGGMSTDFIHGIQGGVIMKHSSTKFVGIQAELNFVQKGWIENARDDLGVVDESQQAIFRTNYIEIPVMTTLYLGNKVRYFLNFGPHLAYLLSGNSTFTMQEGNSPTYRFENRTAVNLEYGATAGIGVSFDIGERGIIQLEGRGSMALNNVIDRDTMGAPLASQNQVFSVSLAYLFKVDGLSFKWKKKNGTEEVPDGNGDNGVDAN